MQKLNLHNTKCIFHKNLYPNLYEPISEKQECQENHTKKRTDIKYIGFMDRQK